MNRIFESKTCDPARNLAVEECLLLGPSDGVALYLWQNQNTVVIGRNQNAWRECRTRLLSDEGGRLVRRSSGGGAVYHDLGNLNFSIIVPKRDYDVRRQLSVLTKAAAAFGLAAEISGRNDVTLATGEKFSGNAFRVTEGNCLHHGTILIDVDMDKLSRYLAPSPEKLAAKGVKSVRARVTNLTAHAPDVSVEKMKRALREAFTEIYGPAEDCDESIADAAKLDALTRRNESWDWVYGRTPAFDWTRETRFLWGGVELMLGVRHGVIESVRLYTDAMDESLSASVERALSGARCEPVDMAQRLSALASPQARDIALWLMKD